MVMFRALCRSALSPKVTRFQMTMPAEMVLPRRMLSTPSIRRVGGGRNQETRHGGARAVRHAGYVAHELLAGHEAYPVDARESHRRIGIAASRMHDAFANGMQRHHVDQITYRTNPKRVVENAKKALAEKAQTPQGKAVIGGVGAFVVVMIVRRLRKH